MPKLTDACGKRRQARLQSHRRATVAQIAERLNAAHDRKVSEHIVLHSFLRMKPCSRRPLSVHDDTCPPSMGT